MFSTKGVITKQVGHLKDKAPLETGFLCFTESLGSLKRRMWRTQKPWELETSTREEMSYLPVFASQHDAFEAKTNAKKKKCGEFHFHNTQSSSVLF